MVDAEKFKTKLSPSENHIFFEKNRFAESVEKSLSIRKKEITTSKKSTRKRSD